MLNNGAVYQIGDAGSIRHLLGQFVKLPFRQGLDLGENALHGRPSGNQPVIPLPPGCRFKIFLPILQSLLAVLFLVVLPLRLG